MEAETYQRALHLWPEWDDSIRASREALGYDPTWPVDQAVAWIEANYQDRFSPRLGLNCSAWSCRSIC